MKGIASITLLFGYTVCGLSFSFASPVLAITPKDKCEYIRRNINTFLPKGVNLTTSYVYNRNTCVLGGTQQAITKTIEAAQDFPSSGVMLPLENEEYIFYRLQAVTKMGVFIDVR
jgi:hypothetical protein